MKVLIYGAGNSIAIFIARYLHSQGHVPILADSSKHARAFYSRYCSRKYIFKDPASDAEGFSGDLTDCLKKEGIGLLLPTTDDALVNLVKSKGSISAGTKVLFPLDHEKINYVFDKSNIPSISKEAGVKTALTCKIGYDLKFSDISEFKPPYAIKRAVGRSGEGFEKADNMAQLKDALSRIKKKYPEESYLVQEYVEGPVYGAGAIFEDNELKHFYSYMYIRRYPYRSGAATICQVDSSEKIREAMFNVLSAVKWHGFCHMDFILEDKSGVPYLIDVNPVHWYSVPNSLSEELNVLSPCLDDGYKASTRGQDKRVVYTTVWTCRELQRIVTGGVFRKHATEYSNNYWRYLSGFKCSDLYWDPMPIIMAPILKIFRRIRVG